MRLRTKLVTLIALASVVPIGTATFVGRELVQRRWFDPEFARLLKDARLEVDSRYRVLQDEVLGSVESLASPEDQFINSILIDLAKGGLDDETFRRLATVTPRVMEERGLDLLTVMDRRGKILASGHFPGRMGDTDPTRGRDISSRQAQLVQERVLDQGKPVTRLAVVARRTFRSPLGIEATVVGGRTLGPSFLRGLRLRGGVEVTIRDAMGNQLAGPSDWIPTAPGDPRRGRGVAHRQEVVALAFSNGRRAATITIAVSDDVLRRTLRAINVTAGALVLSGLLLALVLGALAARRIVRPMQDLAQGAAAVAQGEMDQQLPVRSRDEVGQLVQAFNRMIGDLKESKEKLVAAERVAAWQEIARRIAHEIKNPLFPIQTSIETLRKVHQKKHPDFEEIFDESTTTILEEVERLKNIATEFSQFARMPKPKLAPCDLAEALASVVKLYGLDAIPIELVVAPDLPLVRGDREQLIQVFSNLVKNAREALTGVEAPGIVVRASAAAGWVEVAVQDNGPGFSEEVEANIFTPYFTTKGGSGGSGLGLAIVHRIVMDHDGRIDARNLGSGQHGAVFRVLLPIAS